MQTRVTHRRFVEQTLLSRDEQRGGGLTAAEKTKEVGGVAQVAADGPTCGKDRAASDGREKDTAHKGNDVAEINAAIDRFSEEGLEAGQGSREDHGCLLVCGLAAVQRIGRFHFT